MILITPPYSLYDLRKTTIDTIISSINAMKTNKSWFPVVPDPCISRAVTRSLSRKQKEADLHLLSLINNKTDGVVDVFDVPDCRELFGGLPSDKPPDPFSKANIDSAATSEDPTTCRSEYASQPHYDTLLQPLRINVKTAKSRIKSTKRKRKKKKEMRRIDQQIPSPRFAAHEENRPSACESYVTTRYLCNEVVTANIGEERSRVTWLQKLATNNFNTADACELCSNTGPYFIADVVWFTNLYTRHIDIPKCQHLSKIGRLEPRVNNNLEEPREPAVPRDPNYGYEEFFTALACL